MDSIFKDMIQALVFIDLVSLRNIRCPQDLKFDLNKKCRKKLLYLDYSPLTLYLKRIKSVHYSTKVSHNLCWINYLQFSFFQPEAEEVVMQGKRLCTPSLACIGILGSNHTRTVKSEPKPRVPLACFKTKSQALAVSKFTCPSAMPLILLNLSVS